MTKEIIRDRRTQLRLSQSELSRIAGVSRYKLNVFEAGGAPLNDQEIERVARALDGDARRITASLSEPYALVTHQP